MAAELAVIDVEVVQSESTIDAVAVAVEVMPNEGLTYGDLTPAQKHFVDEFVTWFQDGRSHFAVLKGYAGAGKSACLKVALNVLGYPKSDELGNPFIWACAPTHQAVGVLDGFLGNSVAGTSTLQSLLGLRPEIAKFTHKDQSELHRLQRQESMLEDDALKIELLQKKEQAALEQSLSFQPSKPKPFLGQLRLVIVDECGMVDEQLFTLLHELMWEGELVSPSLQVLFVGDPAQLPPVGETESLTFTRCNILAELTDVVRYSGVLLDYATKLRSPIETPETAHHALGDSDELFTIPANMAVREGAEIIQSGDETVRFICGTNARCRELNYQLRVRLQGEHHLRYEPNDELITTSAIQRGQQGLWVREPQLFQGSGWEHTGARSSKQGTVQLAVPYKTGRCRKGVPVLGTSTYVRLLQDISDRPTIGVIDDYLSNRHGAIVRSEQHLGPDALHHETLTGATFTRQLWRYDLADGGNMDSGEYLWLLDPNQLDSYLTELATLKTLASTTKTRAKGKRGQEGEHAKESWELLGLKDWERWADGTPVTADEFKDLQSYLWAEFHALDCFVDPVTWSYAITCHRAQGVTIDVSVIDLQSIVGPAKKAKHAGGLWDVRKSLYTAATRARKQVVIIE